MALLLKFLLAPLAIAYSRIKDYYSCPTTLRLIIPITLIDIRLSLSPPSDIALHHPPRLSHSLNPSWQLPCWVAWSSDHPRLPRRRFRDHVPHITRRTNILTPPERRIIRPRDPAQPISVGPFAGRSIVCQVRHSARGLPESKTLPATGEGGISNAIKERRPF